MVGCRPSQRHYGLVWGCIFEAEAASRACKASEETLLSYQHTGGWTGLERGEAVHLLIVFLARALHVHARVVLFLPIKTDVHE